MTEEEAKERWPDLDDAARERRRQLSIKASQMHEVVVDEETGRRAFGGPQPGSGRPKKRRLAESIVEAAQGKRQKEVVDALFSGLSSSDKRVRVMTAEKIVKIEHKEDQLKLEEQKYAGTPRDELIKMLAPVLAAMSARGELPAPSAKPASEGGVVEGTAVEVG